jgi:hypothetical protein
MDILKNIAGGMPLRTDDFDLLQNNTKLVAYSIIRAMLPADSVFSLQGIGFTQNGSIISCLAGLIYYKEEIFLVSAASFTFDASKHLYLVEDFSTSGSRTFKDQSVHDVYQIRKYKYVYSSAEVTGVQLSEVFSFMTLFNTSLMNLLGESAKLKGSVILAYGSGFSAATGFGFLRLESNGFNSYMLLGAFNASQQHGKLCVLPVGLRPSGDIVGFFNNGSINPAVLKIKKNGEVYVTGANTSMTNYVSFQWLKIFDDDVNYSMPVTGGIGTVPNI